MSFALKAGLADHLRRWGIYVFRASRFPAKGVPILVTALPKSGSTFLTQAIVHMTKLYIPTTLRLGAQIQHFDPIKLIRARGCAVVSQSHMVANDFAVHKINELDMQVIVLERGISDIVVSLRDHYINEYKQNGSVPLNKMASFAGVFPAAFFEASPSEQYDHIIDMAVPWLLLFSTSWRWRAKELRRKAHFVRYTDLFADPDRHLQEIARLVGVKPDPQRLRESVTNKSGVRFNVGRSGRGRELLSSDQIARIERLIARLGAEASVIEI